MATADSLARSRPDVDADMAREVFSEAAELLHNGLVLDGLGEHDTQAVVAALCDDLATSDPGAAIRASAQRATAHPSGFDDPPAVAAAFLGAAQVLQL